jgi:hypothetical protein
MSRTAFCTLIELAAIFAGRSRIGPGRLAAADAIQTTASPADDPDLAQ